MADFIGGVISQSNGSTGDHTSKNNPESSRSAKSRKRRRDVIDMRTGGTVAGGASNSGLNLPRVRAATAAMAEVCVFVRLMYVP